MSELFSDPFPAIPVAELADEQESLIKAKTDALTEHQAS